MKIEEVGIRGFDKKSKVLKSQYLWALERVKGFDALFFCSEFSN